MLARERLAKVNLLNDNGGECVEVASGDSVMVRDTTDRDGGTLVFTTKALNPGTHAATSGTLEYH